MEEDVPSSGLSLMNTLTDSKEAFRSLEKGKVKLFTCGPSTYQRAHLGNFRTFLYEDILQRYLKYLGYDVTRVLVFTDVEDKAIEQARAEGKSLRELTDGIGERFHNDAEVLHIQDPTHNPRASETVDQSVEVIRRLLEGGYAYWHEGDVYYDPLKFDDFGKLYGLDMSRWPDKKIHFKKDTYPGMRWNLGDFILWHGYREGDLVSWETELGRGRPSWNVQDAAMATKYLGYRIDIACGGIDNLYRHHDYTIAIVEAISGERYANYWLHGEHLLVDGGKMSKSKGNVVYLDHLLDQGYSPEEIRFFLIYGHYRDSLNLTEGNLERAAGRLCRFKRMVAEIRDSCGSGEDREAEQIISGLDEEFESHLNDDLDVEGAFHGLLERLKELLKLHRRGKLGREQSRRIIEKLEAYDEVLQVVSPGCPQPARVASRE